MKETILVTGGAGYIGSHIVKQVYNCGYGKGLSVREVVRAVKEITGKDFVVEEGPRRAGDPAVIVSNVDKILKETNWRPKYNDLTTIITTAYNWELNKRY